MINLDYFQLAHKLNKENRDLLLDKKVHFRANPNSISLISISDDKPELGVKCNAKQYQTSENIIENLLKDLDKIKSKPKPKRPTPEKDLQSWIIHYALANKSSLPFDSNIKFITSELAIQNKQGKKIVTDILGYNPSLNEIYVIELKSERLRKRLIEQVNNFEKIIIENPEFFNSLMAIHNFKSTIDISKKIIKAVVWPYKKTSPDSVLKDLKITEFTYKNRFDFLKH